MQTRDFKTRSLFLPQQNPYRNPDAWEIGIDVGYSGVKGLSRNMAYCFPTYIKKLSADCISIGKPGPMDIVYRDGETGAMYAIGEKAEKMISLDSGADNNTALYGKNRYFSDVFKLSSRTGIGLGLLNNKFGDPSGKKIKIQSGLPPAYMKEDQERLKEALMGRHVFDLKIGTGDWTHFDFTLDESNIKPPMQQPMGVLISAITDKNGMPEMDARNIMSGNTMVVDPGFRTCDLCPMRNSDIDPYDCKTFEELSMFEIMQRTCNEIRDRYGMVISVPAIQNYLEKGKIKVMNRKELRSEEVDFTDILSAKAEEVCEELIAKLLELTNYFQETDSLIIGGGTGAAWESQIRDRFKNLNTLRIISGGKNSSLPSIFSVARGYYMYAINRP